MVPGIQSQPVTPLHAGCTLLEEEFLRDERSVDSRSIWRSDWPPKRPARDANVASSYEYGIADTISCQRSRELPIAPTLNSSNNRYNNNYTLILSRSGRIRSREFKEIERSEIDARKWEQWNYWIKLGISIDWFQFCTNKWRISHESI